MEKTSGDIIILHMCIKKNDHVMYSSWNIVRGSKNDKLSNKYLKTKLESSTDHVQYIQNQFTIQRNLKENSGHIMSTFMWILKKIIDETHKRKSYWSQVQVTTHPVVPYYKPNEQLIHSRTSIWCKIYICSHSITDSPIAKPYILPCILLSTDSPTSQYKNKTIFKTLPCCKEYFNISAFWNYMELGHGTRPCDPFEGTAKREADKAVKNSRAEIQDPLHFVK